MGYSREQILGKCQEAFADMKSFYKMPFINYNGKTDDTAEWYTEVVSEFLCSHIHAFCNGIETVTRTVSYRAPGHDGKYKPDTNRQEERIAMELFNQSWLGDSFDHIGAVIDYQTPLKNEKSDDAGKIDLLAYDGHTLRILELKKPDSNETMLRCVLEGYTYLRTADREKLVKDFALPADTQVKACPLVFRDGTQHQQMSQNRPHLFRLMQLLDSEPYYVLKAHDRYRVTR